MKKNLSMVKSKISEEFSAKFTQVPKEEKEQANCLVRAASVEHMDVANQLLFFVQHSPTIDKVEV